MLRSTIRDFGGERRRALLAEIEALEAGAKNGRNLYLCAVCGTWGTWGLGWQWWGSMDDAEAYVCSDDSDAVPVDDDRFATISDAEVEASIAWFDRVVRELRGPTSP